MRAAWRSGTARALAALLVLMAPAIVVRAQDPGMPAPSSMLTPDDMLGVRRVASRIPLTLALDGGMVAYTLLDTRGRPAMSDRRYAMFDSTGASVAAHGAQVWVADVASGKATSLTEGRGTSWAPVWSPDGRRLAFYWNGDGVAQLWIWERSTGRLRVASAAITRGFFGFDRARWMPDGRSLVTKVLPESLTIAEAAELLAVQPGESVAEVRRDSVTVTVYRAGPSVSPAGDERRPARVAWGDTYFSDLAVIDVASGRTRRLVRSARIAGYWPSPDGRFVSYTTLKGKSAASSQQLLHDIHVADVASGRSRVLVSEVPQYYGISVSWSPDSRWIGYTTTSITVQYNVAGPRIRGDVFVVPVAGGAPRNLTPDEHPYFGDDYRAPAWDSAGRFVYLIGADTLWRVSPTSGGLLPVGTVPGRRLRELVGRPSNGRLWSPDGGRTAYAIIADPVTLREGIAAIDLRTGASRILFEEPRAVSREVLAIDAVEGSFAYLAQDAEHPPEVWIADAGLRERRAVSSSNPELAGKALGKSRLVTWRGADGKSLRGALLLPAGYRPGRRYPLIVWVYGGSMGSQALNVFGLNAVSQYNLQLFASRGYAVLFPDTPLGMGTPVADLASTVVSGVDSLIEAGVVDSTRVGVFGHSFGGYSVLALLTESNRFRAGASSAGFSHMVTAYSTMRADGDAFGVAWAEEGQGRMGGTPWEYPDRYLENSPFLRLDRVTAPVLLLHGAMDSTIPSFLADQTFVGLRRLGKEAMYVRYEGEEHSALYWGGANVRDLLTRTVGWFDMHLADDGAATRPWVSP